MRFARALVPAYAAAMRRAHLGGGLEVEPGKVARVAEVEARLARYKSAYYAGAPLVSDDVYDALEDELRDLDAASPLLAGIGTPVVAEAWTKARHEIPMGSLNKVTNTNELCEWLDRCDELLAKEGHPSMRTDLYAAEKLDGISVELVYVDGRFVDGITRGDGEIGESIGTNVVRMRGVPKRIEHGSRLSVRGEIILRLSDMRRYFSDYTSPRSAAAGTARRLDGQGNEHLTVMCYDLAEELDLESEVAKFDRLRVLGFATPNCYHGDKQAILAVYEQYAEGRRGTLDYEIDGLVVRANLLSVQAVLGELNRRPRAAVAFKFASPMKLSTVLDIRWETGPSGRVTPLAVIEPVVLAGATVQRASLHNVANVERLGIGVGDEVLVSRRNDVIPYIEEVVTKRGVAALAPRACAVCGGVLSVEGEYLMCRKPDCPALVEGRIHNWIDAVGALAWGDVLIHTLVSKGMVREPLDLYRLGVDDIASLERHGNKSAQRALDQLSARLPLGVEAFLAALGIEGFSTQTARLLVGAGYDSVEKLAAASVPELAAVKGLGEVKAKWVVEGMSARRDEIERLFAAGIRPKTSAQAGPLAGKSFCITGSHSRPRKDLERMIEDAGGRVVTGVSKEVDFLLIADPSSGSSKAVKARRYGTRLIDEAELVAMCNRP